MESHRVKMQIAVPKAFVERCQQRQADPAEVLTALLEELVNLNPNFHKEAEALFMEAIEDATRLHTYSQDRDDWS
ncbi:hypothetical protein [Balneatrix alpica]|uniref:Uncharacterized protein n=1 Tax=Balneatrix alpica TaxID=75684 RepID=A0ABV5ZA35_9GAMM|nr:hypothetical protein [Balneatrix alpica]